MKKLLLISILTFNIFATEDDFRIDLVRDLKKSQVHGKIQKNFMGLDSIYGLIRIDIEQDKDKILKFLIKLDAEVFEKIAKHEGEKLDKSVYEISETQLKLACFVPMLVRHYEQTAPPWHWHYSHLFVDLG